MFLIIFQSYTNSQVNLNIKWVFKFECLATFSGHKSWHKMENLASIFICREEGIRLLRTSFETAHQTI